MAKLATYIFGIPGPSSTRKCQQLLSDFISFTEIYISKSCLLFPCSFFYKKVVLWTDRLTNIPQKIAIMVPTWEIFWYRQIKAVYLLEQRLTSAIHISCGPRVHFPYCNHIRMNWILDFPRKKTTQYWSKK